ncbi:hypothetical protein GQ600_17296 [Phytophthora cactorum]|nr:hypothetical protein GQ600_17296 [Phytophthora cactorum]
MPPADYRSVYLATARWHRCEHVVREEESGAKHGYGNPARDPFVRQFMRGLKRRGIGVLLHALLDTPAGVKGLAKKVVCGSRLYLRLLLRRRVGDDALFNRKTAVAERRMYNLHPWPKPTCYRHIHALVQLRGLAPSTKLHLLKTNDAATGCEKVCVGRGKKMSEQSSSLRNTGTGNESADQPASRFKQYTASDTGRSASPEIAEEDLVLRPNQTTTPELAAVKELAHLCLMWWVPDESLHFFKPLSKWSPAERAEAGIMRSRLSVAKMLGEDIKSSWGSDQSRRRSVCFLFFTATIPSTM